MRFVMNDRSTRRLPEDARVLDSYELQLRNLVGVQRHAQPIVERLHGKAGLAEVTADLLGRMLKGDLDGWINSVAALRGAVEHEK
jgi:hypothetical protein